MESFLRKLTFNRVVIIAVLFIALVLITRQVVIRRGNAPLDASASDLAELGAVSLQAADLRRQLERLERYVITGNTKLTTSTANVVDQNRHLTAVAEALEIDNRVASLPRQKPAQAVEYRHWTWMKYVYCNLSKKWNMYLEAFTNYTQYLLPAPKNDSNAGFDAMWVCERSRDEHIPETYFQKLTAGQTVNYLPRVRWHAGTKDNLCSHILRRYGREHASDFHFDCYVLPKHRALLESEMRKDPAALWIAKPPDGQKGHGIDIYNSTELEPLLPKQQFVQRYMTEPDLLLGCKYDLRIYTLLAGVNPTRIYIHGAKSMVRRSVVPYHDPQLTRHHNAMHITNTALQVNQPDYRIPSSQFDDHNATIWSLDALFQHHFLPQYGYAKTLEIWSSIKMAIVRGIMSFTDQLENPRINGYVHFGMDVMLSADLQAHIIEINLSPGSLLDMPLSGGNNWFDVFRDFLNMKSINPILWPIDDELLHEYLKYWGVTLNKLDEESLQRALTEYYRRGNFDLAWPLLNDNDAIAMQAIRPHQFLMDAHRNDKVYNAMRLIINGDGVLPIEKLFRERPPFYYQR